MVLPTAKGRGSSTVLFYFRYGAFVCTVEDLFLKEPLLRLQCSIDKESRIERCRLH